MRQRLERIVRECRGEALWDEPMARHTSLKVGGPADLLLYPADLEDLQEVLIRLREERIPYRVLGGGSNLLVRDGGIRGCVISLKNFRELRLLDPVRMEVAAGVPSAAVSRFAAKHSLTGLEFLCAIPGTFGGAVAVNAGAHGRDVVERVETLITVDSAGLRVWGRHELVFSYRYLKLEPGEVVVSAVLKLEQGDLPAIAEKMAGFLAHRSEAQRIEFPNAGSFFKNPPRQSAWRLIDEAGLRGITIGGAQVSEVHANFLVNRGGATANDFLKLARIIKERVREEAGVELEEEVRIVGTDSIEES